MQRGGELAREVALPLEPCKQWMVVRDAGARQNSTQGNRGVRKGLRTSCQWYMHFQRCAKLGFKLGLGKFAGHTPAAACSLRGLRLSFGRAGSPCRSAGTGSVRGCSFSRGLCCCVSDALSLLAAGAGADATDDDATELALPPSTGLLRGCRLRRGRSKGLVGLMRVALLVLLLLGGAAAELLVLDKERVSDGWSDRLEAGGEATRLDLALDIRASAAAAMRSAQSFLGASTAGGGAGAAGAAAVAVFEPLAPSAGASAADWDGGAGGSLAGASARLEAASCLAVSETEAAAAAAEAPRRLRAAARPPF